MNIYIYIMNIYIYIYINLFEKRFGIITWTSHEKRLYQFHFLEF